MHCVNLKFPMRVLQLKVPVVAIVFLGVPEGAVVHWINGQCAVIAPPVELADLAARSIEESGFALGQSIYGIGHQPAGVTDLGINRGARRR